VLPLGGPKPRTLLAHLVLALDQWAPTDRLIDAVWGEHPPQAVRNSWQTYVSHLRKVLGPDRLEGRSAGYVLHGRPDEVDAVRFERLVDEARRTGIGDPATAARTYRDALALWRGPALGDLADQSSLQPEIARLEELRLAAIEERVEAELALSRHAEVVPVLERLTVRQPLRERLWGQLMVALYRSGRQAEALAAFQRARRTLAEELGVDPSPELQRVHEQVLHHDLRLELVGVPLRGYRLLERLGEGTLGTVHRAYHPRIAREVAIKAVRPRLANDPTCSKRASARSHASIDPSAAPRFERSCPRLYRMIARSAALASPSSASSPAASHRPRPVDEQLDGRGRCGLAGGRDGQRLQGQLAFAAEPQRTPAGREDLQAGAAVEKHADVRRGLGHLLEVVEQQQGFARLEQRLEPRVTLRGRLLDVEQAR
jgi:DNA-binding SARP family transcriptional activator